jgi:hypothetical protein
MDSTQFHMSMVLPRLLGVSMSSRQRCLGNILRGEAAATAALRDDNRDIQMQHAAAPPKPVMMKAQKPPRFRFTDVTSRRERQRLFGTLPDRTVTVEDLEALREMEEVA